MQTAQVNGYELTFVQQGSGVPLVLVHGSVCDCRAWAGQMAAFGVRYRTIAVSLRECWPARWDRDGSRYSAAQHVRDVATFIAQLGAGPAHLLGLSRGGYVAFRIAREYPHLVRALVLAEPGGTIDPVLEAALPPAAPTIALGSLFAATVDKIQRGKVDAALAAMLNAVGGNGYWASLPPAIKQMMRDNAPTLIPQRAEQRTPYARADAARVRVPTLLLAGERSPASFHRILDALQIGLPDVSRVVVPAASHMSNVDNPSGFADAVLQFLQGR